jgi:16S rRNA processing protein RimM
MKEDDRLILVGVISAAHGIKGDVIVKSFTDPKENILAIDILDENTAQIKLKKVRINSNGTIVCRFAGSKDRNTAEALSGTKLFCLRDTLPATQEDEYYISDLRKFFVVNEKGEKIGIIIDVANFGAGDIIEIRFNNNTEEMFPFTKEFFPEIGKDYVVFKNTKMVNNKQS